MIDSMQMNPVIRTLGAEMPQEKMNLFYTVDSTDYLVVSPRNIDGYVFSVFHTRNKIKSIPAKFIGHRKSEFEIDLRLEPFEKRFQVHQYENYLAIVIPESDKEMIASLEEVIRLQEIRNDSEESSYDPSILNS